MSTPDESKQKAKKAEDIFNRIIKKPDQSGQSDQSDQFREKLLKEMYIVEK